MSSRSVPYILSKRDEYALSFYNFVLIGLSDSSANCWLVIMAVILFVSTQVAAPPHFVVFYKK